MMMAASKKKSSEQSYYFNKSLGFINDAEEMEKMHIENGITDSIYVISTLLDN